MPNTNTGRWLNPGSDEAIDAGCTCPVIDNGRGEGYHAYPGKKTREFVFTSGCPVHTVLTKAANPQASTGNALRW